MISDYLAKKYQINNTNVPAKDRIDEQDLAILADVNQAK